MSLSAPDRYHNTTVRLPRQVYERAKNVVVKSEASSFNEFVVQAIEEKVRRLTEAEIDAAFAQMAHDSDYQRAALQFAGEFDKSDWEAFKSASAPEPLTPEPLTHDQPRTKTRPAKTRSR